MTSPFEEIPYSAITGPLYVDPQRGLSTQIPVPQRPIPHGALMVAASLDPAIRGTTAREEQPLLDAIVAGDELDGALYDIAAAIAARRGRLSPRRLGQILGCDPQQAAAVQASWTARGNTASALEPLAHTLQTFAIRLPADATADGPTAVTELTGKALEVYGSLIKGEHDAASHGDLETILAASYAAQQGANATRNQLIGAALRQDPTTGRVGSTPARLARILDNQISADRLATLSALDGPEPFPAPQRSLPRQVADAATRLAMGRRGGRSRGPQQ